MPNEEETKVVEETGTETTTEETGGGTDTGTDTTDWKARFEAEEGRRKRLEKDLTQASESKSKKSPSKSDDFDYGQKAFLIANGVKEADEVALVKDIMASTGKSLDDVMESKYFQAELKEMRDAKLTANALPSGTKRTGQSAQSTVEYWIAKGELPPASDRELRQKVVNARIKSEKVTNVFTNNPVVGKQ